MSDVLFLFDVDAPPQTLLEAVTTQDGIKGFWTTRAEVPTNVGETLRLGFAIAPAPFDLRLERSDERIVAWRTETFPPHWVGTTMRWEIASRTDGSVVRFSHEGFAADDDAAHAAFTWGQIMVRLKEYAESGVPNPVFS